MKDYLFVCQGNVGRSQMAEALCNDILKSDASWSAGVATHTPEKYGHPTVNIVAAMSELGIDVSKAVVKTINQEMVKKSRKIIIMCKKMNAPTSCSIQGKIYFGWTLKTRKT